MQMCGARAAGREEPWEAETGSPWCVRPREDNDQTLVCKESVLRCDLSEQED